MVSCKPGTQEHSQSNDQLYSPVDSLLSMALEQTSSNTTMASMLLEQAKTVLNPEEYPGDLARFHQVKGRLYYYLDEYDASIQHLDTSLLLFRTLAPGRELARTHTFLASSLALSGKFPESLNHWLSGIEILEEIEDAEALSSAYNSVARLYTHQKQYNLALSYIEKSKELVQDTLSLIYANIVSSEGNIYKLEGDISRAKKLQQRAYEIRLRCANIRHIASSLIQLAQLEVMQEDYVSARKHLLETIDIYTELNEKTGLFNARHFLTQVELKANRIEAALSCAFLALELAKQMQNKNHLSLAELNLYKIYRQEGQYMQALDHYENYQAHQAELFSLEKSRQIADIEHHHALESKNKDNMILTQQNKLRKQQIWLLTSVCSFLLVLLIVLFFYTRMKSKSNRQKQEMLRKENEVAEAKNRALLTEKELLEKDLELKNRELTGKTVELLRQIETIQSLVTKIDKIKDPGSKSEIESILKELNATTRENAWEEFHTAFNNVHKEFYDRLFDICPDLSSTEIKIAALLKLNLSSKEIAAISYKSESAVKTARHRLRQKLQLGQDENLLTYLMKI